MTKTDKTKDDKGRTADSSGLGVAGWLPFVLLAGIILAIAIQQFSTIRTADQTKLAVVTEKQQNKQDLLDLHTSMIEEEARLRAEVLDSNTALGIDPEFPSFKFPIYPGLEILESRREEASSSIGEKMDMWYVKGQIDEDLKTLESFYREALIKADLRQTQYISIPGGYAFNYANEWYDSRFTIEQKATDPLPLVEITVYRVRDDSVKIAD